VHETHIHHGVHQLNGSVAVIFTNPGTCDTKLQSNDYL